MTYRRLLLGVNAIATLVYVVAVLATWYSNPGAGNGEQRKSQRDFHLTLRIQQDVPNVFFNIRVYS